MEVTATQFEGEDGGVGKVSWQTNMGREQQGGTNIEKTRMLKSVLLKHSFSTHKNTTIQTVCRFINAKTHSNVTYTY